MILRNISALTLGLAVLTAGVSLPTLSQAAGAPLVINTNPLNKDVSDWDLNKQVYNKPARTRAISAAEVSGQSYYDPTQTLVSKKVDELEGELNNLQGKVSTLSGNLNNVRQQNEGKAAEYYAAVATINTQLQAGTTPGNPRLTSRVSQAEANLENLGSTLPQLNQLSSDAATASSEAAFLLEAARAAYGLSGAVEEDHVRLEQLEDATNATAVLIERVLNNINDDITRTTAYMASERNNLRTLALAVSNGDLYGKSLANRPFSSSAGTFGAPAAAADGGMQASPASFGTSAVSAPPPAPALSGPRPLVKIKFDRPDVNYEQPVYMAVNDALQRYPNARFDLVAVHPTKGNAAQVAIESTKARRNAEKVLRTLTQMGLTMDRIDLSNSESPEAASNEVHLYIR